MLDRLTDKKALITGASSGIGKETAKKLAAKGVDVSLASRTESKLDDLKDSLENTRDVQVLTVPTDIRDEDQVKGMVDRTLEAFGSLDIVINNAGIIRYGDIESFSTKDYRAVMETNVDGMFFTTREVLPHLRKTNGNLIFTGSFDANNPRSFNPIYSASKWWTKGFAHSIESIVGDDDVAVTLINPSEVRTDIKDSEGEPLKEKFDESETIDPEEIAEIVVFAASQKESTTLSQIDVYRRDKMSEFF